jgi:hypothetical protein
MRYSIVALVLYKDENKQCVCVYVCATRQPKRQKSLAKCRGEAIYGAVRMQKEGNDDKDAKRWDSGVMYIFAQCP